MTVRLVKGKPKLAEDTERNVVPDRHLTSWVERGDHNGIGRLMGGMFALLIGLGLDRLWSQLRRTRDGVPCGDKASQTTKFGDGVLRPKFAPAPPAPTMSSASR